VLPSSTLDVSSVAIGHDNAAAPRCTTATEGSALSWLLCGSILIEVQDVHDHSDSHQLSESKY